MKRLKKKKLIKINRKMLACDWLHFEQSMPLVICILLILATTTRIPTTTPPISFIWALKRFPSSMYWSYSHWQLWVSQVSHMHILYVSFGHEGLWGFGWRIWVIYLFLLLLLLTRSDRLCSRGYERVFF
jgi:hypothetical protein